MKRLPFVFRKRCPGYNQNEKTAFVESINISKDDDGHVNKRKDVITSNDS